MKFQSKKKTQEEDKHKVSFQEMNKKFHQYFSKTFSASNNWVIHGSRTASGKPILANDPHLDINAPSVWYF